MKGIISRVRRTKHVSFLLLLVFVVVVAVAVATRLSAYDLYGTEKAFREVFPTVGRIIICIGDRPIRKWVATKKLGSI